MVDWTYKEALKAIKSPSSIPASVLEGPGGLHLGDIHFVELHTTLRMHTVSFEHFEQLLTDGSFNPEFKVTDDYSHPTAILLGFVPDANLMDIESVGIGMVMHWHGGSLACISSVQTFPKNIRSNPKGIHKLNMQMHRMYVMLIRNHGGHMAFTTDLPYCIAYTAIYYKTTDPQTMMILNPENHPSVVLAGDMALCQLPASNNLDPNYMRIPCGRCLLIPRGTHFSNHLFPEIVVPWNHATPYIDPATGAEAPFISMGPFHASDPLFTGVVGDNHLHTMQQTPHLKTHRHPKSLSATGQLNLLQIVIISICGPNIIYACDVRCTQDEDHCSQGGARLCLKCAT